MPEDKIDKNQMLFLGLIQSFVTSAWIQLGKQKNPITDKTEVNLDEAQFTIDMVIGHIISYRISMKFIYSE
ncbi:DUF1844 domain-containing protein [Patescibacteria group bacterium]|nr:DUF1844 domain-containing protein [Patescibacteria group bacterium]